jgi:hypothetical protein
LTIQVGRRARLTNSIDLYLRADPSGAELANLLAASVPEISARCLDRPGPFADRSTAQLWADALIGQVASAALLAAAVRQAYSRSPSDRIRRILEWAELRLARSLQTARKGDPAERLIPTPSQADAAIALYAGAIGDVEQTLAGEEDALDLLLTKSPGSDPYPRAIDLPGHAAVTDDLLI